MPACASPGRTPTPTRPPTPPRSSASNATGAPSCSSRGNCCRRCRRSAASPILIRNCSTPTIPPTSNKTVVGVPDRQSNVVLGHRTHRVHGGAGSMNFHHTGPRGHQHQQLLCSALRDTRSRRPAHGVGLRGGGFLRAASSGRAALPNRPPPGPPRRCRRPAASGLAAVPPVPASPATAG